MAEIDLSEFEPLKKGPPCAVGLAYGHLDDEQLAKVRLAMTTPRITHTMIARRLSEWTDVKVSSGAVSRHRATPRVCQCND